MGGGQCQERHVWIELLAVLVELFSAPFCCFCFSEYAVLMHVNQQILTATKKNFDTDASATLLLNHNRETWLGTTENGNCFTNNNKFVLCYCKIIHGLNMAEKRAKETEKIVIVLEFVRLVD